MVVELFDMTDTQRLSRAFAIRLRVFVEEQGVPAELEIDEHDRSDSGAVHALAIDEMGRAAGTGRFYVASPGVAQVGRMAVLPEARGSGVGVAVLKKLVAEARRRGFDRVHLHAQVDAREFYRKSGFVDDGEPLWDAGILHQPMTLRLGPNAVPESPRNF